MDKSPRNTFGIFSPSPLSARKQFRPMNLPSSPMPKPARSHSPLSSISSLPEKQRPAHLFKQLAARSGPASPATYSLKLATNIQPTPDPEPKETSTLPSGSNPPASATSPVASAASSAVSYTPNPSLLEALNLSFDRVMSLELDPCPKPTLLSQEPEIPKPLPILAPPVQPKIDANTPIRESFSLQLTVLAPPPKRPQGLRTVRRKPPPRLESITLKKRQSSSHRTSRSSILRQRVYTPMEASFDKKAIKRMSNLSSVSSFVQLSDVKKLSGAQYRRSFRHVQTLKRQSRAFAGATLYLPPIDLPSLVFSPLFSEFNDYSSAGDSGSGSSTPCIKTPESTCTELVSVPAQTELKTKKSFRRLGRCPSTFLNLSSPTMTPFSVTFPTSQLVGSDTSKSSEMHLSIFEAAQEAILIANAGGPPRGFSPPPRSDSLRGCSKGSLPGTPKTPEKIKVNTGKSTPKLRRKASRADLTVQLPKTAVPAHNMARMPVVSFMDFSGGNTIDIRNRPLPPTPFERRPTA